MTTRIAAAALAITALSLAGCATESRVPSHSPTSTVVAAPAGTIVYRQYLNADGSQGGLFSIRTDGSHKVQLTKPPGNEVDGQPDFSPDGSKIVFTESTGVGTAAESHHVELMNSDGSNPISLTAVSSSPGITNFDDQAAFSPDGTLIAYAHGDGDPAAPQLKNTGLYVMHADGSGAHEVTALPAFGGDVGGVAWSPDGTQLVYGVFNSDTNQPRDGRAFFLVDLDGSKNHQLTTWGTAADGDPDWSRTTNLIAFRVAPNEDSGIGNVFTIRPDGTGLTQVTKLTGTELGHKVGFSPDGKWIVYGAAAKDGVVRLNIAEIDGTHARALTTTGQSSSAPDWSPTP